VFRNPWTEELEVKPLGPGSSSGTCVFKAHRRVYHSTLGWRVIKKKKAPARSMAEREAFSSLFHAGSAPLHERSGEGVVLEEKRFKK